MLASTNEALRDAQTTYTVLISNIKLVFAYWPLPDIGQIALSGTFSPLPFDYKDDFLAGTSSLNRLPLLQSQLPTATYWSNIQTTAQLLHSTQPSEKLFTQKSEKPFKKKKPVQPVENYPPVQPVENYPPVQPVKHYASNTAT